MGSDAERLERAAADLRGLLREGHELLRDLRTAVKEAGPLAERLVEDRMRERLEAEVERGLAEYATVIRKAMDDAVEKVGREFDRLAAIYLEGSKGRRRRRSAARPRRGPAPRRRGGRSTMSEEKRAALLAELGRLEALARAAADLGGSGEWAPAAEFGAVIACAPPKNDTERRYYGGPVVGESMERAYREHVVAHDPDRTLRRLAADRVILAGHTLDGGPSPLSECPGCAEVFAYEACPEVAALYDAYCGSA